MQLDRVDGAGRPLGKTVARVPPCARRVPHFQSLAPSNGYSVPVRGGIRRRREALKKAVQFLAEGCLPRSPAAHATDFQVRRRCRSRRASAAPKQRELPPATFVLGALAAAAVAMSRVSWSLAAQPLVEQLLEKMCDAAFDSSP